MVHNTFPDKTEMHNFEFPCETNMIYIEAVNRHVMAALFLKECFCLASSLLVAQSTGAYNMYNTNYNI